MKTFLERMEDPGPLVYDGGFGSELFKGRIELTNSALANELHPAAVVDIHSAYIEAGTDVIGTNTFVASPLHLEMAGKRRTTREGLPGWPWNTRKRRSRRAAERSISPDPSAPRRGYRVGRGGYRVRHRGREGKGCARAGDPCARGCGSGPDLYRDHVFRKGGRHCG